MIILHPHRRRRILLDRCAHYCFGAAVGISVAVLALLLFTILRDGLPWLNWGFITNFPSRHPEEAGIKSALWGTVWIGFLVALFSFPLGVGAAIWLEEFAKDSRLLQMIKINIANLAGVPAIIYGLLGLTVFVSWLGMGRSVLAGALTITLLVFPLVIITTMEALRSVPQSYRQASVALGASRWQTIREVVLPAAFPSIATGMILAIARAIGEAAPMIAIAALVYLTAVPDGLFARFTVLPIQIFNWLSRPQSEFHGLAAAGIIVLLLIMLILNAGAIWLRTKWQHQSEE